MSSSENSSVDWVFRRISTSDVTIDLMNHRKIRLDQLSHVTQDPSDIAAPLEYTMYRGTYFTHRVERIVYDSVRLQRLGRELYTVITLWRVDPVKIIKKLQGGVSPSAEAFRRNLIFDSVLVQTDPLHGQERIRGCVLSTCYNPDDFRRSRARPFAIVFGPIDFSKDNGIDITSPVWCGDFLDDSEGLVELAREDPCRPTDPSTSKKHRKDTTDPRTSPRPRSLPEVDQPATIPVERVASNSPGAESSRNERADTAAPSTQVRKKKRGNCCPFCKKLLLSKNFSRHLVLKHADEEEVKKYIALGQKSPTTRKSQRADICDRLRRVGNDVFNREVKECGEADEMLKEDVFPKMQNDPVTAQSDRFGSDLRLPEQIYYCSSKMRTDPEVDLRAPGIEEDPFPNTSWEFTGSDWWNLEIENLNTF